MKPLRFLSRSATSSTDRRRFMSRVGAVLFGGGAAAAASPALALDNSDESQGAGGVWSPRAVEPFIGEIMMVGFNFAPRGWAFCDGSLLPIAQNTALFSLLGTIYGGDGRTTFALPDLRGRVPMFYGSGPGLSTRQIGERGGVESVTLTTPQTPAHTHEVSQLPDAKVRGAGDQIRGIPTGADEGTFTLATNTGSVGGGQAHENMPPFLAVNFVIALVGQFPSRN